MNGRWLAGKVGGAILTMVFVLIFNFFLFRAVGDPTEQLARLPGASDAEIAQLKEDYGLNKSLPGSSSTTPVTPPGSTWASVRSRARTCGTRS